MRGIGTGGSRGPAGADGVGVPPGGTSGQVLAKNSATDHDTAWKDPGDRSASLSVKNYLNFTVGGANGTATDLASGSITDAPAGKYILQASCYISTLNSGTIYLQYSLNGTDWDTIPDSSSAGTHNVSGGYRVLFGIYDHNVSGTVHFRMVFVSEGYSVTFGYANDSRWARFLQVYRVGSL